MAEQAKELAAQPVLLPGQLEQQAPLHTALMETLKRWTTYIVERIPQLTVAQVGHLTDIILDQGFTNPKQLTFMTLSQLQESRSEWKEPTGEPVKNSSWEMVLQLRRAPEPSQELPPPPTPEPQGPGTAETLYSALKVSTQFRSSQLLKSILGLTDKNSLPTPRKTLELLKSRPGYEEAHREGLIGLILDPLVDQRLFESLMTKSRDSYASGIRHWSCLLKF